jgi:hypothetical protein
MYLVSNDNKTVFGRDDALRHQHIGMGDGPGDVLGI